MARKPKPALAQWVIDQRKAHGESVTDIARVTDRSEATVRGWEAGRPPQSDDPVIAHLERHWGSIAPNDGNPTGDLASAIVALTEELLEWRLGRAELEGRLQGLEESVKLLNGLAAEALPKPPVPDGTKG